VQLTTAPVTTVAALQLLSLSATVNGQDVKAYRFLESGRRLAERLGLLDAGPGDPRQFDLTRKSPEEVSAASYAAWGAYNWIS
jgi:hypothetical protein